MKKRKIGTRSQKGRPKESCLMCRNQSLQALPQGKEGSSLGYRVDVGHDSGKDSEHSSQERYSLLGDTQVRYAHGRKLVAENQRVV